MNARFSIITVSYNAAASVADTLQSAADQVGITIEHILIDGASTDGTLEKLTDYRDRMAERSDRLIRLVSEPDQGMYHALNKGVAMARGDVIGVLHADDVYATPDVLAHVAAGFAAGDPDAVYGDLVYVRRDHPDRVVRRWRSGEYRPSRLKWGWMPPHPAFFLKRCVYERVRLPNGEFYDTRYRIAADYDFILRVFAPLTFQPAYLRSELVRMRLGGVSNRNLRAILRKSREDWAALRRNRVGGVGALLGKNLRKLPQFIAPLIATTKWSQWGG